MNRRGFLKTLGLAPAVILTPGLLMPVRKLLSIPGYILYGDGIRDDTAALQAMIEGKDVLFNGLVYNAMRDFGNVVQFPTATFALTDTLRLAHAHDRVYDFGNSTIQPVKGLPAPQALITIPAQKAHTKLQFAMIRTSDEEHIIFTRWTIPGDFKA